MNSQQETAAAAVTSNTILADQKHIQKQQIERIMKIDSRPIQNAQIGPIAYLSKYHGGHVPNQQNSSLVPNNPPSISTTSNLQQLLRTDSVTNYGLAQSRQVTPLIQQNIHADGAGAGMSPGVNQQLTQGGSSLTNDSKLLQHNNGKLPH